MRKIWAGTQKFKGKEGQGPTNNILPTILSPKTQKKVGEGILIMKKAFDR